MPDLHIRPAEESDRDSLWTILEPVIREGTTYPVDRDATKEEAFAYWFAPNHTVLVAEAGGQILGTYYFKPNSTGPAAHVANAGYMVHPAARGRGVASAMGRDSFARAKAAGYHAMQFNLVVATNEPSLRLWRSLGMTEVGRLPKAFRHPDHGLVDAFVMYRLL